MFLGLLGSTGSSAANAMLLAIMTSMMNTSKRGNVTMECIVTRNPLVDDKRNREEYGSTGGGRFASAASSSSVNAALAAAAAAASSSSFRRRSSSL